MSWGAMMAFHKIIWIAEEPRGRSIGDVRDQSAPTVVRMNLSKCIIAHGDKNRLPPGRNELRPYVPSCISPLDLAPGARLYIPHVAEPPLLYQQMRGLAERLAHWFP